MLSKITVLLLKHGLSFAMKGYRVYLSFSCYVMDYSLHMHCLMKTILTVLMPIIRCMLRVNPRLRITT